MNFLCIRLPVFICLYAVYKRYTSIGTFYAHKSSYSNVAQ